MKKRFVRVKYGVDEDTCTGDHSCIRLSGCPTLTVKPSNDPLKFCLLYTSPSPRD